VNERNVLHSLEEKQICSVFTYCRDIIIITLVYSMEAYFIHLKKKKILMS